MHVFMRSVPQVKCLDFRKFCLQSVPHFTGQNSLDVTLHKNKNDLFFFLGLQYEFLFLCL